MTIGAAAPLWLVALLFLFLGLAAAEDGWRLRISNVVVVAVAATGMVGIGLAHLGWGLWQPIVLSLAILAVGTPLFGAGWLGGGDVKLLAASGLWFTLADGWRMLVMVAIAGGVLTVLILLGRLAPWPEAATQQVVVLRRRGGIPYGIAIALGVAAAVLSARALPAEISALPSTSLVLPR